MGQGDHSKQNGVKIKIPDPIITFLNFQSDPEFYKKLQVEIQKVIWGASPIELPPDYWIHVHKLFKFLETEFPALKDKIVKYISHDEMEETNQCLSLLDEGLQILRLAYEKLIQDGTPESERSSWKTQGVEACQNILTSYSDKTSILYKKFFVMAPVLVVFAGIYRSFSKIWGQDGANFGRQRKEMERLTEVLEIYKNLCIQERMDNIKMLRHQSESFNVHDYSYEAQIRKDVAIGCKINDYYDKRTEDVIKFQTAALEKPEDADLILARYKDEVTKAYEAFFNAAIHETESSWINYSDWLRRQGTTAQD